MQACYHCACNYCLLTTHQAGEDMMKSQLVTFCATPRGMGAEASPNTYRICMAFATAKHAETLVCYIATDTLTWCIDSLAMICGGWSWHAADCASMYRCCRQFVEYIPASLCCGWSAASDECSPEAAKGRSQPTPLDLQSAGLLQGRAPKLQHPPTEAHPAFQVHQLHPINAPRP